MSGLFVQVKPDNKSTPPVITLPYYAGSTFNEGAVLIVHTDGTLKEAAADPVVIAGFALHAVGTGSGAEYPIGYKEFPPLYATAARAVAGMHLICPYVGTIGTPGVKYAWVRDTDGFWKVDFTDTGNDSVTFIRSLNVSPLAAGLVEVALLASNVQEI